jgi:ribonuclease J
MQPGGSWAHSARQWWLIVVSMKVRILRGAREIGGSCVQVEASGESLLVDAGMPLYMPAKVLPNASQFAEESLRAVLISHPHLDHYGLLPWLPPVPVVLGAAGRRILRAAAPFMRQKVSIPDGPDLIHRQPIQIGPFSIIPFIVDHSAYEAYALLIEAGGKRLFYSGDLRAHGRKRRLVERLIESPPKDIDVLMLEGTSLGQTAPRLRPVSEGDLEGEFVRAFGEIDGLALVQTSAQNVDRLVTIYRACRKANRTLVLDLYAAQILEATGNPRVPQSHWDGIAVAIPHQQRLQIKRNGWFEALARHSRHRIYPRTHLARTPSNYVLMFRPIWMAELERAGCLHRSRLIHSQWAGYLEWPAFAEVDAWRQRNGMGFHQIHTSGHASPRDLQRIAVALNPGVLVPIHTARPDEFHELYPRVKCHADGEWWAV